MLIRSLNYACGLAVSSFIAVNTLNTFRPGNTVRGKDVDRKDKDLALKQVQVIFRHGARTPIKTISGLEENVWDKQELRYELEHTKLKYEVKSLNSHELKEENSTKNVLKGGCEMGALTTVGQQQAYDLGRKLKKYYIDELKLVDDNFDERIIYLRTTHVPRAIESLRCVVTGMFNHINEPVIFWTLPIVEEVFFPNYSACKALKQFVKYCFTLAHKLPGYQGDLEKFMRAVGKPMKNINFIHIYDDMSCRNAHNKIYSDEVKSLMKTVEARALQLYTSVYQSPPTWTKGMILPLSGGHMLQNLYKNIQSSIEKTSNHRLYLFSAHDATLITLCAALDIELKEWPSFASYVSLELYENEVCEHFVRVVFSGDVKNFKKFSKEIPIKEFKAIVDRLAIDDYERVCNTMFDIPEQSQ
ncbi:lysophosphatidic acid phosphatase type 6-like [Xenia sp. Carnegie-2017]|uniref:lysophosphatidic acid phosphatase type 6-like n=1 Tax=Xenia sp. Carnegie-2017 TaxID=2897299 RepID=UPI001F04BD21|nr:lysophosphatidic acid phosphatase type 6-like [Xenia sp. Carnegie-2017]